MYLNLVNFSCVFVFGVFFGVVVVIDVNRYVLWFGWDKLFV